VAGAQSSSSSPASPPLLRRGRRPIFFLTTGAESSSSRPAPLFFLPMQPHPPPLPPCNGPILLFLMADTPSSSLWPARWHRSCSRLAPLLLLAVRSPPLLPPLPPPQSEPPSALRWWQPLSPSGCDAGARPWARCATAARRLPQRSLPPRPPSRHGGWRLERGAQGLPACAGTCAARLPGPRGGPEGEALREARRPRKRSTVACTAVV
jgi:hypothetical protein